MKKTIILTLALIFTINANAQSFMTNTVDECIIREYKFDDLRFVIDRISVIYNVRICMEIPLKYRGTSWPDSNFYQYKGAPNSTITFTNATFGHVFGIIMEKTTNLVWRYESSTDSIYICPATNAITMTRLGPISMTNVPVLKLIEEDNVLGVGTNLLAITGRSESDEWVGEISLNFPNEVYMWEVLDAITMQMPNNIKSWDIFETPSQNGFRYWLIYFDEKNAIMEKLRK